MGLVDPRAVAIWRLNERHDSVLPSDAVGNLADLNEGSHARPAVVDGTTTGFGRRFVAASSTGLEVVDTDDALALTRGLTVLALVELDVDAQDAAGTAGTLVQRGTGAAGVEVAFGLTLSVLSAASRLVRMRLWWQTTAGAKVVDTGVTFSWPAGEALLLGATREVVDGQLVVRYQVNGESADGGTHALDVGAASGADVFVGVGHEGTAYADHLDATLDMLEVLDEAVCVEEFELLWYRLSVDVPAGIAAMRRLVPEGVYSTDPDSSVQRELAIEGAAFGIAKNYARRLRDYFLPAKAWGSVLERWEAITRHKPLPGDWLQRRRDRVGDFLGTILGFAVADIQTQLAEPFDQDAADVQIIEHDNDLAHDFAPGDPGDQLQDDGTGTWTFTAGEVQLASSAAEVRFQGITAGTAPWLLWSVAAEVRAWIAGKVSISSASTNAATIGLLVGSRQRDEWLIFGLDDINNGTGSVRYAVYKDGTLSPWTELATGQPGTMYLRVRCLGGGEFELRWGTTADAADAATPTVISGGPAQVEWAGFVGTVASTTSVTTHDSAVDDLLIHTPNGRQRFNWYAYRDPSLPGNPDVEGADLTVRRIRPAHTHAAAIDHLQLQCDTVGSTVDRYPMGL